MTRASTLPLPTLLAVVAVLTGTENKATQSPNIAAVLKSRLVRTYETLGEAHDDLDSADLDELQYITAKVALCLVEKVQDIIDPVDSEVSLEEPPPLLGTRDLSQVRTLLSIIFKWAIQPLLTELELHRPGPSAPGPGEPQIIDLTERQLDFKELPSLISRLLHLIFASGNSRKLRQTWVTTSLLNHHAVDMLRPCILLGWNPRPLSDSFARASNDIKPLSIRFINILLPQEAITALGAILSSTTSNRTAFTHVPKVCAHLLSNQLKRPDGIRGFCAAILGEDTEDSQAAPLEKLEHIARVLRTVPSSSKPEAYYQFIIPRILELLLPTTSGQTPGSHKRAAAFTLSRMITPTFQHNSITSAILLPVLHGPFLSPNRVGLGDGDKVPPPAAPRLSPAESLQTLQAFLLHTDPSPTEVSTLLTPIVPELYTLLALHRGSKTVDPSARESLNALLHTWGRIVSSSDVINGLCSIVNGSGGDWELGPEGFTRSARPSAAPSISLATAAELEGSSKDDIDISANPFNLRPDPSSFVDLLKSIDRKDAVSEVFVRLLNDYRQLKETESDPMRTLLHLQLILQLQSQMSATILSKPEHVLSFIKHALVSAPIRPSAQARPSEHRRGLGLEDLRIVDEKAEASDDEDSDDEDEEEGIELQAEITGGKDEMIVTAITLLLSILEGHPEISPNTAPDLKDILDSLESLTSHISPTIRQLSREARLVLTARTASTSSNLSSSAKRPNADAESAQETYQKALKLLQDPIIPVRAHGLQLLRDLVSNRSESTSRASGADKGTQSLDPALVPGILSIFLQSIQDDESYLFLNAVQGLAAMVDGYGKDVLRGVVDVYLSGTGVGGSGRSAGTSSISNEELDARVRVGEALTVVVKRCGSALGIYTGILVPPLLTILRSSYLPTTLRTSAIAILAQCVETHAPAMVAYTPGLADTCVELIQLESVAAKSSTGTRDKPEDIQSENASVENKEEEHPTKPPLRLPESTDIDPMTKNAKIAPFRRSALHFLSQLLRSHTAILYDSRQKYSAVPSVTLNIAGSTLETRSVQEVAMPESVLKRAGLVLGYVAATDEDAVTRVMAREASEFVEQYQEACLGL